MTDSPDEEDAESSDQLITRHMRAGWVGLLVFVTLGTALETMHAFKLGAYLDVGNETRRLMWTLAHAHGVGLSLVNMLYASTLHVLLQKRLPALQLASTCILWASVLIPGGFVLGGIVTYGGDPGVGVFLVPVGALLLWVGVFLVARQVWRR